MKEYLKKYSKVPIEEYPNHVTDKPLVSVCIQTYQHAKYIRDCLNGILMQDTSFDYEILLGEDNSTDGTREICIEFAKRFPDKIRLFLHSRKNNITINGSPTGRYNLITNLVNSRGKYIALCEGDDYWTDMNKLQIQVDFLEQNSDYSICFHDVKIYKEEEKRTVDDYITKDVNSSTTIYDLAEGNYIHTPSVVYRNGVFNNLPSVFFKVQAADYFLHMLAARRGWIKKIPREMAVYRVHGDSFWSNRSKKDAILSYLDIMVDYFEDEKIVELLRKRKRKIRRNSLLFYRIINKLIRILRNK